MAVLKPGASLRGDRAHARPDPRDGVADAGHARGDHDPGFAGRRIDGDDREGVELQVRSPGDRLLGESGCGEPGHRGKPQRGKDVPEQRVSGHGYLLKAVEPGSLES